MKKPLFFSAFMLLILTGVTAQNIYESIGKKAEILTLSNGKYQEIFSNDTLVRIGTVLFNTVRNEVVDFVTQSDSIRDIESDVASRFLSIDPIGREYPELSPYQFGSNTPIVAIDVDGLEAEWMTNTIWSARERVRRESGDNAAQEFDRGVRNGTIATGVVLTDIFITKGWLSRAFGTIELLNAVSNDHAASNIKGNSPTKAKLSNEASEGYKSAIKGYALGKAIGIAGKAVAGVRKWSKITQERTIDLGKEEEGFFESTAYNAHIVGETKPIRVGSSYMDEQGFLNFDIEVPKALQKQGIAGEIFKQAIEGKNPIAIQGTWLPTSSNYKEYRRLIDVEHINPEKAVFMTPTGKLAARNGFGGTPHINMDNQSGVQVVFNKPN